MDYNEAPFAISTDILNAILMQNLFWLQWLDFSTYYPLDAYQ